MQGDRKASFIFGVVLIGLGALFLIVQLVPGLEEWFSWPVIIIGVGVLLLALAVLTGVSGLAVPACIVGGIGGLLYWQNLTGDWESWIYAWTLIPGFVGVGVIVMGLLDGRGRKAISEGGTLILISLIMFAGFGSFLSPGHSVWTYWPALLIILGVVSMLRAIFRRR